MAALTWDSTGTKKYENGISKGVLYKYNSTTHKWEGVAWNGLTSVSESPEGADKTDLWADNIKYASMRAAESFGGTIEAYTYPPEFESCDGSASLATGITVQQQNREMFRLCYRTEQGNDEKGANYGYKLHLVYGCTCSPSERSYETINDSPDAITFSWEFDTTPINVSGKKATSLVIIDSTAFSAQADQTKLANLEKALYGTDGENAITPWMPDPDQLVTVMNGGQQAAG